MRWPLSLLFRGDRDAPAAADGAAAVVPRAPRAPGAAAGPAGPAGVSTRPAAWSRLPPVQRATRGIPLTAPTAAFVKDLAGHRPPEAILRPLAHDLAPDGPPGLVSGIATPLVAGAPSTAAAATARPAGLPARRAVQRRARTTSLAAEPARDAGIGAGPERPDEQALGSAAATSGSSRELPVVGASFASAALGATRVDPASAPEPARPVAPVAGPPVQRSGLGHGDTPASAAGSRSGLPATPPASPAPAAHPAELPSAGAATSAGAAPALPSVQRRTLGESRRLGLGVPLAVRPASLGAPAPGPSLPVARAARSEPPPAVPAAPRLEPVVAAPAALSVLRLAAGPADAGRADVGLADAGLATAPPAGAVAPADGPGVPGALPLQRSADLALAGDPTRRATNGGVGDLVEAGWGPATGADGGGALPLARGAAGDSGPTTPRAALGPASQESARPLPGVAGSAAAAAGAPPSAGAAAAPGAGASRQGAAAATAPLVVARSMRASGPALRSTLAGVPTGPSPVPAQRGAGAARDTASPALQPVFAGPDPSRAGHSAATPPMALAGVSVQRASQGVAPEPDPAAVGPRRVVPGGTGGGAQGRPGSRPVARPGGSSTAGAATVVQPPVVARSASAGASASAPPRSPTTVLGWSAGAGFAPVPAAAGAVVQRTVEIDEISSTVEPEGAAGAAHGGASAGQGGTGGGQDYEEIADRVYDRIRSRFATELLLDRERMGLLIDG